MPKKATLPIVEAYKKNITSCLLSRRPTNLNLDNIPAPSINEILSILSTNKSLRSREEIWKLAIYFDKCAYFKNLQNASNSANIGSNPKAAEYGNGERGQFIAEFCKEL